MDPKLLRYYNNELQHIREMAGEFAKAYPKIAGRLGLEGMECADPYVERLLEGFAFLSARVHLKIDAEFPRFTQHLLEMIYPHYLTPLPSMAVVQMKPDLMEGNLASGFTVPRDTALRSGLGRSDQTPCEYRTAHDTTLWPLEISEAVYYTHLGDLPVMDFQGIGQAKAALRLRIKATANLKINELALDKLVIYLQGTGELPMQLYERILANGVAVVGMPVERPAAWYEVADRSHIRRIGFAEDEALLPYTRRSFSGYRLLQEYFAFPERFLFVELGGLAAAVQRCDRDEMDVVVLLNRTDPFLEQMVKKTEFALYCTPAINLFPKRCDRIHLNERQVEYHVIPDRSRPMDFEVYHVRNVTGFGTSATKAQEFLPFYAANDYTTMQEGGAYYAVYRTPRILSERQKRTGPRSSYMGSEMFLSLVDAHAAPYRSELRQLGLETLCTNRDLPLHMPVGQGRTDFTMEIGAPVNEIRCVAGPTRPRPSHVQGETAWRLISHLSLNYLSLTDTDNQQGASALRELLMLYGDVSEAAVRKQVEGVKSVKTKQVTRRLPIADELTVGRGLQVTLTFDEAAFEGSGVFLMGAVLEQFFGRYVTINSFTETVIATLSRGEIMRWPIRIGQKQII